MNSPFLPRSLYIFLFSLLGLVYFIGLFVPLMDNDSAHHANIALRMHLTGDYVNLIEFQKDYLDKPHLHFWLSAMSYKILGVSSFAYKFPSFLFTILGTYSTYRLGKSLYDKETGKLAALIIASSFAYMLANNDVRMDAILTACIAFTIWQLVAFIQNKHILNIAGAALGLALGFSTKGHIAVFVPAIAVLFYLGYRKEWKLLLNPKCLLLLILFGMFISPVVYCYYLQYNLHPEKMVRGENNINGVNFILFNQSIDRFSGKMNGPGNAGGAGKNDYFFFLHSFLWAFAPWSVLAFIAIAGRIKTFLQRKPAPLGSGREEWLTTGVFVTLLLIVSFSGFKLPHYLNIVFPTTAVLTAAFVLGKRDNGKWIRRMLIIQAIVVFLLLLLCAFINAWAFPVKSTGVVVGLVALLAVVFYFIKSKSYTVVQKNILIPVTTMAFIFFLLNSNFYPQLLTYQGGNELAFASRGKVDGDRIYNWKEDYSSSFNFYTSSLCKNFSDSVLQPGKKTWLLYDTRQEEEIINAGYHLDKQFSTQDYEITRMTMKFLNPSKRNEQCKTMVLAEISR